MCRTFIQRSAFQRRNSMSPAGRWALRTTAVTRSRDLPAEEIEFMRWKAERWMKVRHLPAAFAHDPWFVVRHGRKMLAHTFRGTTWRRLVGLESTRDVFARFRQIRRAERRYLDWPDPLASAPPSAVRTGTNAVG